MFLRFLIIGVLGFVVDAGLTHLLIAFGLSPLLARPPAVVAAMLVTWAANRRFTFEIQQRGSLSEVARYAGVAAVTLLLNLALYSCLVLAGVPVLLAIVVTTAAQAVFSFTGYRRFVFNAPARAEGRRQ